MRRGLTLGALLAALAGGFAVSAVVTEARASVSIAVTFDALVRDSSGVAVVTPVEQRAAWEDGRIYTYTRVHIDTPIAGAFDGKATAPPDAWVRTMGGIVGHIGQSVDGEPTLYVGRPCVLFLHAGPPGTLEVTARAQGQFGMTLDGEKQLHIVKSGAMGAVLAPRNLPPGGALPSMAADVLHGRLLADASKDIAAAWTRLHAR